MNQPTEPSINALLIAASDIVDATAHSTIRAAVRAAKKPRTELAHINAAKSFTTAADFMFQAAEWVASGDPVRGEEAEMLRMYLRWAEAKLAMGIRQLAKA